MSSFLVSRKTLLNAASAINLQSRYLGGGDVRATAADVAELAALNIKGFQVRYGADREDIRREVRAFRNVVSSSALVANGDPLKAYKALRCVLYQAYEGNVPGTKAFKRWEGISNSLAHRIASDAADAAGVGWDD